MGWKPIDTAPKRHGVLLLLATERGVVAGSWGLGRYDHSAKDYERAWTDGPQNVVHPTHWMEMPEPPAP